MSPTASVRLTEDQAEQLADKVRQTGRSASDLLREAVDRDARILGDGLKHLVREQAYAAQPCPYRFDGTGASLIRDLRESKHDSEARGRLDRFRRWQGESARFATVTTDTASEIIPPGYREVFVVPEQGRPLGGLATRGTISDGTPFALPGTVSTSDGVTVPGEGNTAPVADLGLAGGTVTPAGLVGRFVLTRELVDASSPAADMIALAAAREDWRRQAEARVYAELNGANGQGGTITGGFVPSGARVRTASDAGELHTALKAAIAEYAFHGDHKPTGAAVSRDAATTLAELLDETSGDALAMWRVQGAGVNPAPVMLDADAADGDVLVAGPGALWEWTSSLLEFRFSEKAGPGLVEVALWGYHATRLIRPVGLSAVRFTG